MNHRCRLAANTQVKTQPRDLARHRPTEFLQTGRLRGVDMTDLLQDIHVPTLWLCGGNDEARPATVGRYAELAGGELLIVDGATHCAHLEFPQRYLCEIGEFLTRSS